MQREKKSVFWVLGLGFVFALLWFFIKNYTSKKLAFTQGSFAKYLKIILYTVQIYILKHLQPQLSR